MSDHLDKYLDPMPCLLRVQFDGEEEKFVPNGGMLYTEAMIDMIVDQIVTMVRKKNKRGTLRWQQASKGVITHHAMTFDPQDLEEP